MHRSASTRNVTLVVLCIVMIAAGGALSVQPWSGVAQDERNHRITVEVVFLSTEAALVRGDACGYLQLGDIGPHSEQLLVRDAAGVIVGTVDLLDIFNPTVFPAPDEAQPGTIDSDGNCVITSTLSVTDSAFYTFTIEGRYDWTVSRDQLDSRDWSMRVAFF